MLENMVKPPKSKPEPVLLSQMGKYTKESKLKKRRQ